MTELSETPVRGNSYSQVLKSTMLMGSSSAVNVASSLVRNKAIAIMLGPDGIGLVGLYSSILDIAQAIAGLGVQQSGVRQIAEATGSGDWQKITRTVYALRKMSVLLGLGGGLLLIALSLPISQLTFGSPLHAAGVAILSLALLFRIVSAGQAALIQGMRSIGILAWINVLAAFAGTVTSIPLVYLWGADGIVPSLIAAAAVGLAASWWYSRKALSHPPSGAVRLTRGEVMPLLKLGMVFMASGFMTFGSAYAIRIIVLHEGGIAAAGLYQAAWALGGLYCGFILQAMGADFYPRLTAVAQDNGECNRLVNEQAQVGILLAGPGVVATLTFAPFVLNLLYAAEFHAAADLLRWICLGMMLRIVSWPMGYIVVAKGAQGIYFWTDVAATVVHVGLAWVLVGLFGTVGAGAAFCSLYVWHSVLIYVIVRRMSGFRWSATNVRLGAFFLVAAFLAFGATQLLSLWWATAVGCLAIAATGTCSLKGLAKLVPPSSLPRPFRALVARLA